MANGFDAHGGSEGRFATRGTTRRSSRAKNARRPRRLCLGGDRPPVGAVEAKGSRSGRVEGIVGGSQEGESASEGGVEMAVGHHAHGHLQRDVAEGRKRRGAAGVEDAAGRREEIGGSGCRRRPTARRIRASAIRIPAAGNRPSNLDGGIGVFFPTFVASTGWTARFAASGVTASGVAFR